MSMSFLSSIASGAAGLGSNILSSPLGKAGAIINPVGLGATALAMGDSLSNYDLGLKQISAQEAANKLNAQLGQQNLALQREAFDYQKSLNAQTMQREDTEVQRHVKDLAAAGLSPLSDQSGASSSQQTSAPAPQNPYEARAADYVGAMSGFSNSVRNALNTGLQMFQWKTDQDMRREMQEASITNMRIKNLQEAVRLQREGEVHSHNLEYAKTNVLPYGHTQSDVREIVSGLVDLVEHRGKSSGGNLYSTAGEFLIDKAKDYLKNSSSGAPSIASILPVPKSANSKLANRSAIASADRSAAAKVSWSAMYQSLMDDDPKLAEAFANIYPNDSSFDPSKVKTDLLIKYANGKHSLARTWQFQARSRLGL